MSRAMEELKQLAELTGIPVAATPFKRGIIPDDHPLGLGKIGTTATWMALEQFKDADMILAVGSTISELTTDRYGNKIFPENVRLIHIDIDPEEIGKTYPVEASVVGDAKAVLAQLIATLKEMGVTPPELSELPRVKQIAQTKKDFKEFLDKVDNEGGDRVRRVTIFKELRKLCSRDAIIVAESGGTGLYTRFAMESYVPSVQPGDLAIMGSGYPMAMGAAMGNPDKQVIAMVGDGAIMMTLQEMQTAAEQNIPVVLIIMHNNFYGSIKYKQVNLFEGRSIGCDFSLPNFANLAKEFGLESYEIRSRDDVGSVLKKALDSNKPTVIDAYIDPADFVPPSKVYAGFVKERQM